MSTAVFAVLPSSFVSFDEHGCHWATDIDHAYRLARRAAESGEDQVIWRVPFDGNPYKWATVAGEMITSQPLD